MSTATPSGQGQPHSWQPGQDEMEPGEAQTSWLDLIALILRHRRILVLAPFACAVLLVGLRLAGAKKYTTTLSFTAVSTAGPVGSLASLAGQFGVNIGLDPAVSPDYYASVLATREVLQPLVEKVQYRVFQDGDTVTANFITLYEIEASDSLRTIAAAIKTLSDQVLSVSVDHRTGIVTVRVRTMWRELSVQMANELLAALERFNIQKQHRQSGAEQQFLQARLDSATMELRVAENALEQFLAKNRSWQGDPALVFEQDRLRRAVDLRANVFSLLTQGYEQARIAAVRTTPSLAIVEPPRLAFRFDRRHTLVQAALGGFFGTIGAVAWLILAEALSRARQNEPERFQSLRGLWAATVRDARTIFLRRAK